MIRCPVPAPAAPRGEEESAAHPSPAKLTKRLTAPAISRGARFGVAIAGKAPISCPAGGPMKTVLSLVLLAFFAFPAIAQESPAATPPAPLDAGDVTDLSKFLWKNRVLVILADSPGDPRFAEQMDLIQARVEDLAERDVVVLIDTAPDEAGPLRDKFRPRGFMLVLIGKDGNVYLRKPRPWDVREISRSIDKMPIRREELRNN
ncbi:MAG: DUF4174 domain-containing protein [Paracoccaceae bacterium]